MNNQIENIDNLSNIFDEIGPETFYMKEKITNFYFPTKFRISFKGCFVAISKDGGLVALCKKKSFLDTQKNTKINTNVIVMNQNAKNIISIPINWNYSNRWIVSLDFTENEKLYGICNDGTIYKFDTVTEEAKEILTSKLFQQEKIEKALFIEKGFVALTCSGTFYYVKEFKKMNPISIFQISSILEFSNDVDFIAIPPTASRSGKLELLFTNEKGDGVVHVMEQPKGFNYSIVPTNNENILEINGVSILEDNELKPYYYKNNNDDENTINTNSSDTKDKIKDSIGKIIAMAISPLYNQIALYNNQGKVYLFSSQFDRKRKETKFEIDENLTENQKNEQKAIIQFCKDYQFLFCGEDAIALSGQRFIMITSALGKTLSYQIVEGRELEAIQGAIFSKCISEVDGLRFATNDGMFLISKVNNDLYGTCFTFSDCPSKKLLKAYKSDLMKEANFDKQIRKIYNVLPDAILSLANASANVFWIENEEDGNNRKEAQLFMLKAAQLGKYFLQEGNFNFDKFIEICKNIRIINELRNNEDIPLFITYSEYENLTNNALIQKIMSHHNYNLAFRVSKYLGYDTDIIKIYQKWACCKIKKLNEFSSKSDQMKLYNNIMDKLSNVKKISYIKLAKKAFKCNQNDLGMKFLELEKSILAKIPQYLSHSKWDKALELSYETYDSDIIESALSKIADFNIVDRDFIEKIKNVQNIRYNVVDYLKKNRPIYIEDYLESQEDYEELMFYELENYFKTNKIEEKKKHLKSAKEYQKKIDKNNSNNKFYLTYVTELEKSVSFKKECMDFDRNIIKKNYIESFDNSIYDCYQLGAKEGNEKKIKWIEGQNKNYELDQKKMSIMKIRALAENGNIDKVDKMIKESSLKKLNLTPLNMAEFYFEYKNYNLAVEYIKQINNNNYFDYKVDMLIYMEKYEDALDIIISSKNTDKIPDLVNDVLIKKPSLQSLVKELCEKYKVNLN